MKKIISLLFMMGAFAFSMNAQTQYFVVSTPSGSTEYDVTAIDSICFIDRSQMVIKADTVIEMDIQLPADASNYSTVDFSLPVKQFYTLFGYESALACVEAVYNNEVYFYFYSNSSYEIYSEDHSSSTANNGGCWFSALGDVCSWGTDSYFFIEPSLTTSKITFHLGQYPGMVADGEQYTLYMGLQKDSETYVAFKLNITIGEIIQEAFSYDTYLEINEAGYDLVKYEIDTTGICSSFGMTLDEVINAIGSYEIILYPVSADGVIDKSEELMDMDGYWFDAEGAPCASDNEKATIKVDPTFEGLSVYFSQYPYACTIGDMYTIKVALSSSDVDIVLTFNITITEVGYVPTGYKNDGKNYITIYGDVSASSYEIMQVDIDPAAIAADLEVAAEDVLTSVQDGTITFANLNADESEGSSTANNGGAWYGADGNICSWGTSAMVYAEPTAASFGGGLTETVGQYPGHCAKGDVYTIKKGFFLGDKKHIVTYEIHIK